MSEAFITYSPYVDNTTLSFSTGASSATTPQWVFAPAQINVVTPDDEELGPLDWLRDQVEEITEYCYAA